MSDKARQDDMRLIKKSETGGAVQDGQTGKQLTTAG